MMYLGWPLLIIGRMERTVVPLLKSQQDDICSDIL